MDVELHRKALKLFFELLERKVIPDTEEIYGEYRNDEIRDYLSMVAEESGARIIYSSNRIQITSKGKGSPFATNFTHLKSKFDIENKDEFNLISIILVTYLASVDNDEGLVQNSRGFTLFAIEEAVHELITDWRSKVNTEDDASEEAGIDMKKMVNMWMNLEVKNETKRKTKKRTKDKKSRIGLVSYAMSLLRDEGLVYLADQEEIPRAIPKYELFDRLEHVYHNQPRFQEIKELITESEGVVNRA